MGDGIAAPVGQKCPEVSQLDAGHRRHQERQKSNLWNKTMAIMMTATKNRPRDMDKGD